MKRAFEGEGECRGSLSLVLDERLAAASSFCSTTSFTDPLNSYAAASRRGGAPPSCRQERCAREAVAPVESCESANK